MSIYYADVATNIVLIIVCVIVAAWAFRCEARKDKRPRCKCCRRPL